MNLEIPDIFRLRNVLALLLALATEWGLATLGGVPFKAASFALILLVYLVAAWALDKLARRLFGRRARGATDDDAA